MIDSHCHLDHEPLFGNLNNVILNSKKVGIEKILTICTTKKSFKNILEIIKRYEIIFGTYGIHPHETSENVLTTEELIEPIIKNNKIIGVGETGLDFYYNNSDKISQIKSFKNHIEAALKLKIPLIVHSRNAENETFELLNRYKKNVDLKILMHCFTGSRDFANKLLIETDSPFLSPVPMRGKKNEPSYIKYTLKKLSKIKNIDKNVLDKITTNNFNNLFFN